MDFCPNAKIAFALIQKCVKKARAKLMKGLETKGGGSMSDLQKIAKEIAEKLNISFLFYAENTRPKDLPVCDKQFEGTTDDGKYTYFRFMHKNVGYIGVLEGAGDVEKNYATLLPAYLESFAENEGELSKTEHLKRILLGECSSMSIDK